MDPMPTPEAPWQAGLRGARANIVPGIVLQLLALALVIGYYNLPPVHGALARLMVLRESSGVLFGVVSTAVFGGVIPFLYLWIYAKARSETPRYGWLQGLSVTAFWAYKGIEVDFWYRLQARMVGSGHEFSTIALKVVLDQFVYCPVLAVPVTAIIYGLVESHADWAGMSSDIRAHGWYRRRVLPILISNLGVWVPAVAVIYAMPTELQLPLQNIVLCFFTLIVANQTRNLPSLASANGAMAGKDP
jgi:hypothetical protein